MGDKITAKNTAEKLGISEGTVKVRVYRAIRKLQQLLERDTL